MIQGYRRYSRDGGYSGYSGYIKGGGVVDTVVTVNCGYNRGGGYQGLCGYSDTAGDL